MVHSSTLLFFYIIDAAIYRALASAPCSGTGTRFVEGCADEDEASSFLQLTKHRKGSKRITQEERIVQTPEPELKNIMESLFANETTTVLEDVLKKAFETTEVTTTTTTMDPITEISNVEPFECRQFRMPMQMSMLPFHDEGFSLIAMNTTDGTYDLELGIPFETTKPAIDDINGCGINPIDGKLYCQLVSTKGMYVVRVDMPIIEYVAIIPPYYEYNAAAFGPSGTFYVSAPEGFMALEDLHSYPGYDDLKANSSDLWDVSFMPLVRPKGWKASSDLVAINYDFGDGAGEQEYVIGPANGMVQIAKYDFSHGNFSGSWKLNITLPEGNMTFGAGWNFQQKLYFLLNHEEFGNMVVNIPLGTIDLTGGAEIALKKVGKVEEQLPHSNGVNCETMPSPWITNVRPFDCVTNPVAAQVYKVGKPEVNATNFKLPCQEIKVAADNFATGESTLIYSLPCNVTKPAFVSLNAVGINPVDKIAYGALKMEWWKGPDEPSPFYIVRFDEEKVEFIAKVQGTADAIAGSFDRDGTFFVSAHPHLWAFEAIDTWEGMPRATSPKLPSYDHEDAFEVAELKAIGDLVVVKGEFDGGQRASWVLSLNQVGQLALINTLTDQIYVLHTEKLQRNGGGNFGAAWNFRGKVFFSSNDGEGVWQIPLDRLDVFSKDNITLERVGPSGRYDDNDGMNCLGVKSPL